MASLRRIGDHAGDQGARSDSIAWNEDGSFKEIQGRVPKIGNSMLVGSVTARSYSRQDYWLTTPVTEILEEIKKDGDIYIKFKTGNSTYEWWEGKYPEEKQ